MFRSLGHMTRLIKAGRALARHDALFPLELRGEMPASLLALIALAKIPLPWEHKAENANDLAPPARLAAAMAELGPSYIKLGQFLSTRPDIVGAELAAGMTQLQDRLPPFPTDEARAMWAAQAIYGADL